MKLRLTAAVVALLCASGCAQAKFNPIAPGAEHAEPRVVPSPVDFAAQKVRVHLDPTVVLWALDAHIEIRREVADTIANIDRHLHAPATEISIAAGSYRVIPDVGIGGFTDPKTGEIVISMDSRSPIGLRPLLTTWLPLTIAHELHHAKRVLDGPGYGRTLLDTMVAEGGAEAFVRELFPSAPPIPWVQPLAPAREREVWREAEDHLDEPDEGRVYERWFVGKDGLPRWAGYRIGYAIVRAYLDRHHRTSAADIATMPSRRILEESGYEPGA